MNIYDKDLSKCIGCGNCVNICNKNAVILKENKDGFIYPKIDFHKCVNCGMCVKKCPIDLQLLSLNHSPKIKIVKAKNLELLFRGSSGGFFPTVAQYLLEREWVIFGAIYDNNIKKVVHSNTEIKTIQSICRSKYAQSLLNDTFKQIRLMLKTGKNILFIGTPCQVYALYLFLGARPHNLITLDFICHGVASPGFFTNTVEYWQRKAKKEIIDVIFREKVLGWRHQVLKLVYNDSTSEIQDYNSPYYYAFTHNYSIRKCCYKCNFPRKHQSDISMGDAWSKDDVDDTGLSIISINTLNGQNLFESLKNEFYVEDDSIESWNLNDACHNYSLQKYNIFFKRYRTMDIENLNKWIGRRQYVEKYINRTRVILGKLKNSILHV